MELEKNIAEDILDIVTFIKDNAVSKTEFNELKADVSGLRTDVDYLKAQMVTKVYLDDKLAELRGDLVVAININNDKSNKIVDELEKREVLDSVSAGNIKSIHPFPKPHRV